jgi:hypothetical protein
MDAVIKQQSNASCDYAADFVSLIRSNTAKKADRAYNLTVGNIAKQGQIVVSPFVSRLQRNAWRPENSTSHEQQG